MKGLFFGTIIAATMLLADNASAQTRVTIGALLQQGYQVVGTFVGIFQGGDIAIVLQKNPSLYVCATVSAIQFPPNATALATARCVLIQ
jgi:hypothetical protein